MELELSEKYEPLFRLLYGDYPEVDTVVVTGGRFSQKSFAVGTFACVAAKDFNHRVLYTRYTLVSSEDSIIPEFREKIDFLGAHSDFEITRDRIRGIKNNSKIVFKGIKTSAGNQTAALKSLKDFSLWVYDEAEEHPDFDSWDKVKKSIRSNDVRNISILLLNPVTKNSWIYETFFEERGVVEGFNGVVGNVLYIHTTYHDMPRQFIPDTHWNDFEAYRAAYEEWEELDKDGREMSPLKKRARYYKHTLLGGWLEKAEGVIYDNWVLGDYVDTGYTLFGADFGFSIDPSTLVEISVDKKKKIIYLREHLYKPKLTTSDLYDIMNGVCRHKAIIADSAEPRLIEELRRMGLNIKGAVKGPGSITAGIALMQDYDLIVDTNSINLIKELNNYRWNDKKSSTPMDSFNHILDAARYAASEMLNGSGVMRGSLARALRSGAGAFR